jgi:hypothetical protein
MTSWSMGIIRGGHGVWSHMGGSGTIMPSARAEAGRSKVEISTIDIIMVNITALGFIISSWMIKLLAYLSRLVGCVVDGRKILKVPVV